MGHSLPSNQVLLTLRGRLLKTGKSMQATVEAPTQPAISVETLLERVRAIAPIITEHAAAAERERRLSKPVFEAMRDAGLYRMWIPRELGGYEVDPVSGMKVFEAVARLDSAAAWNLQIAVAASTLMAFLPDAGAEEICSESPQIAGALFPPGRAVPVEGGYRISARCPFVSGCHQASWYLSPTRVMDGDNPRLDENGQEVVLWAFYEAEAGEILDTWHTLGMRGTGSHDIVAEDVFVPERRMARPRLLTDPGKAFRGPSYRTTIWPAVAALAPPALGIAQSAIELVIELGSKKKPNYLAHSLGESPVVQSQLAEAEAMVGAARAYLYESLDEAYESALEGRLISEQQKLKAHLATCYAIRSSADAVDLVCRAAGTTAIRETSALEKHFRDVQVITKHAHASTARYESLGKLMLGLETDWEFCAL